MRLEIICQGIPDNTDRVNEDAFVAYQRDDGQPRYVLAAIDGATSVTSFGPLHQYLAEHRNHITPAALAASVTRDAILAQLGSADSNEDIDPSRLILAANDRLRRLLDDVAPQIFNADAIAAIQPELSHLLDDPRKIRLFLPAAVITLVSVDTYAGLVRFAHAGDTALLLCYHDGHVIVPTQDDRTDMNYESALVLAGRTVAKQGASMLDAVNDPFIRNLDRDHRIYHNFVDKNGATNPARGVGVIDGLPQLADYIRTGMITLDGLAAIIVVSDGAIWPAPLHETPRAQQARYERMWAQIRQEGLSGYLAALRAEERADSNRERYPRFKLHDDATAVALWLSDF